MFCISTQYLSAFSAAFLSVLCVLRFLRNPICDKHVGLVRDFAVSAGNPHLPRRDVKEVFCISTRYLSAFSAVFLSALCVLRFLRNPICDKHVRLVRDFAVSAGNPDQLLAVRAEHGEAVEAVGIGDALEVLAVEIDAVEFEVAHPAG